MRANIASKLMQGLREIVIYGEEPEVRNKALDLLLLVNSETQGIIQVDNYMIPAQVYTSSINEMKSGNKIMSIKVLRDGLKLSNGDSLSLRDAKELSERISIIEKIPMNKGYNPEED